MIKFYNGSNWEQLQCSRDNDSIKATVAALMDAEVESLAWKTSCESDDLFVIFNPHPWALYRELYLEVHRTQSYARAMYDTLEDDLHTVD